jgi:hypothetical protein
MTLLVTSALSVAEIIRDTRHRLGLGPPAVTPAAVALFPELHGDALELRAGEEGGHHREHHDVLTLGDRDATFPARELEGTRRETKFGE